jgi:hypothetical protein
MIARGAASASARPPGSTSRGRGPQVGQQKVWAWKRRLAGSPYSARQSAQNRGARAAAHAGDERVEVAAPPRVEVLREAVGAGPQVRRDGQRARGVVPGVVCGGALRDDEGGGAGRGSRLHLDRVDPRGRSQRLAQRREEGVEHRGGALELDLDGSAEVAHRADQAQGVRDAGGGRAEADALHHSREAEAAGGEGAGCHAVDSSLG